MGDLDFKEVAPILLFSITTHEKLEILFDQVLNISIMCPSPTIVIHMNDSFRDSIGNVSTDLFYLKRIQEFANVYINPQSLPTRWAHMFQAHVSNFEFAQREKIPFDYLILASSGDLIIRPGLAQHVSNWDMGVNEDNDPKWHWRPFAEADPIAQQLVQRARHTGIVHAAHEGSFYSYALAKLLFATLREHVSDWDYNSEYPKEEVFLPTLAMGYKDMRKTRSLSNVLGWSVAEDRSALRRIFSSVGVVAQPAVSSLGRWVGAKKPQQKLAPFMISRIPRDRAHPLRLLLGDITPMGASDRARFLASKLTGHDIKRFDINFGTAKQQRSIVRRLSGRILKVYRKSFRI